jgi:hypothetical protein
MVDAFVPPTRIPVPDTRGSNNTIPLVLARKLPDSAIELSARILIVLPEDVADKVAEELAWVKDPPE